MINTHLPLYLFWELSYQLLNECSHMNYILENIKVAMLKQGMSWILSYLVIQ